MATTLRRDARPVAPLNRPPAFPKLKPGPDWPSFEQFRTGGSSCLDDVHKGRIGTLRTKGGVFRIVDDDDFQSLLGLASEVERLRNGLSTMVHAAKVIREHPDSPSAIDLLIHVANQYSGVPVFPVRGGNESVVPETSEAPADDEVILDPSELRSQVTPR